MAGLRWVFALVVWVALELSGPVLFVPVEAFEGSEEATHRSPLRRRDRASEARAVSARRQEIREDAARLSRLVAIASLRSAREVDIPRKLPPSESVPDPASDDH
jgi:hypothetical protein